ncbi:DUF2142 domain-containing protein [Microbacterium arborescens]|uniref:DUF2142 domain-containing protein n=1 Tax=Microbacterium arborescens TaxID=33883 RepID=UPI0027807F88|nr:DUF2142 domain-containing protein [Microbacterium arborescens]MDQ1215327.1 putative membrane protein [Microbacterium arborescens]
MTSNLRGSSPLHPSPGDARSRFASITKGEWGFLSTFVGLAVVFCLAFTLAVPAGFGLDEEHHTYRSWQVSRGVLEPETISPRTQYGGTIPVPLIDYVIAGTDAANAGRGTGEPWERHDIALAPSYDRLGHVELDPTTPTRVEEFTNASASSFVPYLPSAIGMRAATALGADVGGIVLAGKLVNAMVYVLAVAASLMILARSRWKWLVGLVGLSPLSVFQASVISADTFSNAAALLFTALILRSRTLTARAPGLAAAVVLAGLLVVLAKPTYILLLPLLFAVPSAVVSARSRLALTLRVASFLLLAGIGAFVSSRASDIASAIRFQIPDADRVDQRAQLAGMLSDPFDAIAMVARTVIQYGSSWIEGTLTMMGTNTVFAPAPITIILIGALTLAMFCGEPDRRVVGALFAGVALVTVCAIIATLYMTFTVVGAATADGVQGRYWIPLLIPALAGIGMLVPVSVRMSEKTALSIFGGTAGVALSAALAMWVTTVY